MMKRDDERAQVGKSGMGASMARSPGTARKDEESHVEGGTSKERDSGRMPKMREAGMADSPKASRSEQDREMSADHKEELGEHKGGVSSGPRSVKHHEVEADHVIGDGGEIGVSSAEGHSDNASAKANRKEAGEPEREENEKMAMGGEREKSVAHKNVMGHGERETIGKHTI